MNYILFAEMLIFISLIVAYIFITSKRFSKAANLAEAGSWLVWAMVFQVSRIKAITFFIGLGIIALVKYLIAKNERRTKAVTH